MRYKFIQQHRPRKVGDARVTNTRRSKDMFPHRDTWPVRLMCKVLNVSASGFYDSLKRKPSKQTQRRDELTERITLIHHDSHDRYGSPRVYKQLRAEGESINEKTVAKIMKHNEIRGKTPKKYKPITTDSDHNRPIADNLLVRDFSATQPNEKWVADITYIDTDEGWLYLAVIMDVFSRKIVGWQLADHMKANLVCEALAMAITHRNIHPDKTLPGEKEKSSLVPDPFSLLVHSDRGSQYASDDYQELLQENNLTCSMSRKGNCYDNAMIESFFGTLKTELDETFIDQHQARAKLFDYIEVFYNRQRMHSSLGYVSPAAYEQKHQAA